MARTFQTVQLLPDLTVLQNVCLGAYIEQSWAASLGELIFVGRARRRRAEVRAEAVAMLEAAGLADIAKRSPDSLPYGHQRIVEVDPGAHPQAEGAASRRTERRHDGG